MHCCSYAVDQSSWSSYYVSVHPIDEARGTVYMYFGFVHSCVHTCIRACLGGGIA